MANRQFSWDWAVEADREETEGYYQDLENSQDWQFSSSWLATVLHRKDSREDILNRVSGQATKTEKVAKVGHNEENGVYTSKVTEEANLLPDVVEKLGQFVLFMSTMM